MAMVEQPELETQNVAFIAHKRRELMLLTDLLTESELRNHDFSLFQKNPLTVRGSTG